MKIKIASTEVIHFIGIGGVGMNGLAKVMHQLGFKVQGSDQNDNVSCKNLRKIGLKIFIGHNRKNIKNSTIIVASSAIKKNNVEFSEAIKKKLPIFKRGEMLANVISLKKNIIISGSHGKTTTTSLVSNILSAARLDPTVINGGIINSIGSTARLGKGEWAVIESDESDGSFLKLPVNYSIVTNVDKEHLEYYKQFKFLKKSFQTFIEKTPSIGKSFVCSDDLILKDILKKSQTKNILTYGFNSNANFRVTKVKKFRNYSIFNLKINYLNKKFEIKNIPINLIGKHNILNSTAAIAVSLSLGISIKTIKLTLKNFSGIQRRLTKIFTLGKKEFYDDYAHHPTEIKALLKSVREVNKKRKIISVFQPHRYSRVTSLYNEFSSSFKLSNTVLLCPVYSAGEKRSIKFDQIKFSRQIFKNSKVQVINIQNEIDLKNYIKKNLFNDEIVICMGAGSISNWIRDIGGFYDN